MSLRATEGAWQSLLSNFVRSPRRFAPRDDSFITASVLGFEVSILDRFRQNFVKRLKACYNSQKRMVLSVSERARLFAYDFCRHLHFERISRNKRTLLSHTKKVFLIFYQANKRERRGFFYCPIDKKEN